MLFMLTAASVIAAFHVGRPHHHVVRCEGNHACILNEAQWECSHWHSRRHCRIWDRWQARLDAEYHRFEMAEHPAITLSAPAQTVVATGYSSSDLADVPGVPYAFAACVAFRESTDGAGSPDIYGIEPMWGYYDGMPIADQKALFARIYAEQGVAPWQRWDGC
jgi:hypothetical protein